MYKLGNAGFIYQLFKTWWIRCYIKRFRHHMFADFTHIRYSIFPFTDIHFLVNFAFILPEKAFERKFIRQKHISRKHQAENKTWQACDSKKKGAFYEFHVGIWSSLSAFYIIIKQTSRNVNSNFISKSHLSLSPYAYYTFKS